MTRSIVGAALAVPLGLVFCASSASAQAGSLGADEAAPQVEEIIVSARKRDETARDVPAAIVAIGSQDLEKYNTRDLWGLQNQVPGLIISDFGSNSGGTIALRGLTSTPNNPAVDPTVGIVVDNVQIGAGAIIRLGQFDLQQVEVLKGPQALFFGKNSPAGVMSLRSADPRDVVEVKGSIGYEFNAKELNIVAIGSGPITDTLGLRVAVSATDMKGWLKNDATAIPGFAFAPESSTAPNKTEIMARATLLFKPTSDLTVRAKYSYTHLDDKAQLFDRQQRIACPYGTPQNAGYPGYIDCKADNRTTNGGSDPRLEALLSAMLAPGDKLSAPGQRSEMHLASLEANYQLAPDITATSITGYFKLADDFGGSAGYMPGAPITSSNPFVRKEFTQEVRLASVRKEWPINFMIGGLYQSTKIDHSFHVGIDLYAVGAAAQPGLAISPLDATFDADGETISFFGQLIATPIPEIEIAGGARWLRETKSVSARRFSVPKIYDVNDLKFENLSPEITVRYRPTSDWTLFAAWRNGFKSGGFNESAASTGAAVRRIDYRPEEAEGFELGAKFGDGPLSASITAYSYKYKNLQVSTFDPGALALVVSNAAAARIKGIEADIKWRTPLDGLDVHASANYNRARYTSHIGGCYTGQTIAEGCNLVVNPANGRFTSQDLGGRPLVLAPDWTGNFGLGYLTPIGNNLELGLTGDVLYSSSFFAQLELSPVAKQKEYANVDASIYVKATDNKWKLALLGRNLTQVYRSRVVSQVPLTGIASRTGTSTTGGLADYSGSVNRGREIMVQASFQF